MTNIMKTQTAHKPASHIEGDAELLRLSCLPREDVLLQMGATLHGLSTEEAQKRLVQYGPNRVG
jgi:hypothetical protein